jgi:purine-nucleoside phosphorylase
MASGILDKSLNHNEVIETAEKVRSEFIKLVTGIIGTM